MTAPVMRRLAPLCRVVVDNDFAGDPDGLVGLAPHLMSPTNRVTAVTSSFLNPRFAESATTAEEGTRLAAELVDKVGLAERPPVVTGAEEAWKPGARSSASDAIVAAALVDDELPLFVVCGGPLTNVAAALEQEPGIATRMALVWIGGSLGVDAFEYNRDPDPVAADYVFSRPGLVVHQFPLETYRQCAYSVHELAEDVGTSGRVGAWLWEHYQSPARVGATRRGLAARGQPAGPGDRAEHRVQQMDDGSRRLPGAPAAAGAVGGRHRARLHRRRLPARRRRPAGQTARARTPSRLHGLTEEPRAHAVRQPAGHRPGSGTVLLRGPRLPDPRAVLRRRKRCARRRRRRRADAAHP